MIDKVEVSRLLRNSVEDIQWIENNLLYHLDDDEPDYMEAISMIDGIQYNLAQLEQMCESVIADEAWEESIKGFVEDSDVVA